MAINEVLTGVFLGNKGEDYLIFTAIILGFLLFYLILHIFLIKLMKKFASKTKIQSDDIIVDFLSGIKLPFYLYLGIYFGSLFLSLPNLFKEILKVGLILFLGFYIAKGVSKIIDHFAKKQIEKKESKGGTGRSMIMVLALIGKIFLWVIIFLMALSNLGIEITPLIAGLGVGGIAIALALQTVLSDLFSAFAIYFDKPFVEGDFLIIGNDMGTVKHIGIKSTRLETLQGQELIVSNSELTSTRINNYKRMQKRRIVFGFGVEYSTPVKKLKKINEIIKKITESIDIVDLDRVHFKEFGDSSLNYEVVYYVKSSDYNTYAHTQEKINLKIKEAFEKEKIEFAFPSRTVYLKK